MTTINGITRAELIEKIKELKQEVRDLTKEYNNGDPDEYSPDWYDYYVFPMECDLWKLEDQLEQLETHDEEADE